MVKYRVYVAPRTRGRSKFCCYFWEKNIRL